MNNVISRLRFYLFLAFLYVIFAVRYFLTWVNAVLSVLSPAKLWFLRLINGVGTKTEIVDGLWLGGELLPGLPHEFDAVVDCRLLCDFGWGPVLLWIPFEDTCKIPPLGHLWSSQKFIAAHRELNNKILVHCTAGHNRSGLILAAYLIGEEGYSAEDAISLIQKKRPGALTNQTFVDFLHKLQQLRDSST